MRMDDAGSSKLAAACPQIVPDQRQACKALSESEFARTPRPGDCIDPAFARDSIGLKGQINAEVMDLHHQLVSVKITCSRKK
jgi:hypothetical protein